VGAAGTAAEGVTAGARTGDGVGLGVCARVGVATSQPSDPPESGTVVQPGGCATAAPLESKAKPTVNTTAFGLRRLLRLDGVSGGSGQAPELLRLEPTLAPVWRIETKS
jgi:hypothetical protein